MLDPAGDIARRADFHKNKNSDIFMASVERCLFLAFKAQLKEQEVVLILDNPAYHHHCTGDDFGGPSNATEADDTALLRPLGMSANDVVRKRGPEQHIVPTKGNPFARAPRGTHGRRTSESESTAGCRSSDQIRFFLERRGSPRSMNSDMVLKPPLLTTPPAHQGILGRRQPPHCQYVGGEIFSPV